MAKAGGYVLRLTPERFEVFDHALSIDGRFAEAVPSFSHGRSAPLICFIIDPSEHVTHIARGRRGVNAGTQQSRLNIEDVHELRSVVPVEDIVGGVPNRNKKVVGERFGNGGLLSPKAFQETIDLFLKLAPDAREQISRFTTMSRERLERLSPEARDNLAYQKEALSVAMSLAGIDREPLAEWILDDDTPDSFLDGLPEIRMREDPMVIQDMRQVPGYNFLRDVPNASAAVFEDGDNRLTVIMANRQPLEEQTGTDLIYYNERFKSFIMVQYKAMEPDDVLGSIFRFPESKLTDEVQRMDEFLEQLSKVSTSATTNDYRLTENPFFLKFCPRIQFQPDDTGLTKGMYVPHGYWKLLETDDRLKGPRGGRRLAYSNVGRYFDNTSFISMVRNAWVGTTIPQSALLEQWMRQVVEGGRSITFAVKPDDSDPEGDKVQVLNPNVDTDGVELGQIEERQKVHVTRG